MPAIDGSGYDRSSHLDRSPSSSLPPMVNRGVQGGVHDHPTRDLHSLSRNGRNAIARRRVPSAPVPRVVGRLEVHFSGAPGVRVNGDTFIYYVEGDPRRSVSPDCYVVFGLSDAALRSLSLEGNNTYLLWEVGKAPDFILEIGSRAAPPGLTWEASESCTPSLE